MLFKIIINSIFSPSKSINSGIYENYSFIKIHVLYMLLLFIASAINVSINLYDSAQKIIPLVFLYQTIVTEIISYFSVYLPILVIYFLNRLNNRNYINFCDFNKYLFPVITGFNLLRIVFLMLFQVLHIYNAFSRALIILVIKPSDFVPVVF